jgi:hypothetical protein
LSAKKAPEAQAKEEESAPSPANPLLLVLAWLLPGAGHFALGRRARGILFFLLVIACIAIGWQLDGKMTWEWGGSPLKTLITLGTLGSGSPVLLLRYFDYSGLPQAPGYEYGGAFLVTAGLMNLLLVLDTWDIARGQKE